MFVDSHCHLDKLNYDDLHIDVADVINKAKQVNVEQLLSVGVTLDSFPKMLELIEPFDNVHASCGVHPLDVESPFPPCSSSDQATFVPPPPPPPPPP
uniref:TatD family hydrolase n=1 Tax=Vibrio vulnificus TaxID=672 RepID=UPI001EEC0997